MSDSVLSTTNKNRLVLLYKFVRYAVSFEGHLPYLVFYPLAFGYVLNHDDTSPRFFRRFPDRRYCEIHPDNRPVLRNVSFLQGVVLDLPGQQQRRFFLMQMKIIRMCLCPYYTLFSRCARAPGRFCTAFESRYNIVRFLEKSRQARHTTTIITISICINRSGMA